MILIFIFLLNKKWHKEFEKDFLSSFDVNIFQMSAAFFPILKCTSRFGNIKQTLIAKLLWTVIYIIVRIILILLRVPTIIDCIPLYLQIINCFAEKSAQRERKNQLAHATKNEYKYLHISFTAYRYVSLYQIWVTILTFIIPVFFYN